MKKIVFIAVSAMISVYFVGCGIGGDSLESKNIDSSKGDSVESKNIDSTKTPTLSSEDYSHLPECKSNEDKGCIEREYWSDEKIRLEFIGNKPISSDADDGIHDGFLRFYTKNQDLYFDVYVDEHELVSARCSNGLDLTNEIKEYGWQWADIIFDIFMDNIITNDDKQLQRLCGKLAIELQTRDISLPECKSEADKIEGCIKREYWSNKNLKSEIVYQDGNKEGIAKWYHIGNGKLRAKAHYKNDKREGIGKIYYANGAIYNIAVFSDDKFEGISRIFYRSGSVWVVREYKDNKHDGVFEHYLENGNLSVKGHYQDGNKQGKWKTYKTNGTLQANIVYKDNTIIQVQCADGRMLNKAELSLVNNHEKIACE